MLLIPAHAKVNLCLAVRGRREDGYHEIDSVAVTIDWHDLVGVELAPATATLVDLRVSGDGGAPSDGANLASRAAQAVAAELGPLHARLWLDKRLPSAAGLGGGSADAAAVLRACRTLAAAGDLGAGRARLDGADIMRIGAGLGSDVPVLVAAGAHRMRGRGEILSRLDAPTLHMVVALAGESSTAATYAAVREDDLEGGQRIDETVAALERGESPDDVLMGSGLEAAACRASADLGRRLRALRDGLPGTVWHLTGSGGAAFSVVRDAGEATDLAAAVTALGFRARACRTVSG